MASGRVWTLLSMAKSTYHLPSFLCSLKFCVHVSNNYLLITYPVSQALYYELRKQRWISTVPALNNIIWIFSECLLCTRHTSRYISFNPQNNPQIYYLIYNDLISFTIFSFYCLIYSQYLIYSSENWSLERLSNLPKIIQLERAGEGFEHGIGIWGA